MILKRSIITFGLLMGAGFFWASGADNLKPLLGTWEYRQKNGGSPTGFDKEGERLIFKKEANRVTGQYFGLERMGEEGLYYTATEIKGLSIADSGQISFTVPARDLFSARPLAVQNGKGDAGVTRDELRMKGSVVKGQLHLTCEAVSDSCPEKELTFRKGNWR